MSAGSTDICEIAANVCEILLWHFLQEKIYMRVSISVGQQAAEYF